MNNDRINSFDDLQEKIKSNMATLVYFSSPTCGVCQVLQPKIMQAVQEQYPEIKKCNVDISITPEISSEYQVLSAPTVILFLEGKEFIRKYRTISVDQLIGEIKRPYEMMVS